MAASSANTNQTTPCKTQLEKLRQIIRDGEKLQASRSRLSELVFYRRLKVLEASLVCYIRTGKPMLLAEYESGLNSEARAA